jgi:aspartate aminotransferase-like enzyme
MEAGLKTAMLPGSGTLANDVVAATLAADPNVQRGIILVNGEFGQRLVGQAKRFGLDFIVQEREWGQPWHFEALHESLHGDPTINWIWGVHLESSTGRVNNLQHLSECANTTGRHIKICMDCVSSLGAVPIDAEGFHLVSGASGKSLGSYTGVALVFADPKALKGISFDRVPNYYDLDAAFSTDGPRFTFPSPSLLALDAALDRYATPEARETVFAHYRDLGRYVRSELRRIGLNPLVDDEDQDEGGGAAPVITTFRTPHDMECAEFLDVCRSWGYELSGLSGYLAVRKWAQIATMGSISQDECRPFFIRLRRWIRSL